MVNSSMSRFVTVWLSERPKGAKHNDAKYSADIHCDSVEHRATRDQDFIMQVLFSGCIAMLLLSKVQKQQTKFAENTVIVPVGT